MDQLPKFIMSTKRISAGYENGPAFEKAEKEFRAGHFFESLLSSISFLNKDTIPLQLGVHPDGEGNFGNRVPSSFVLHHGSVTLEVTVGKSLKVHAPFLKLKAEKRLPIYRQVVEINQSTLMLASFTLADDVLSLDFECPIEATHPDKMLSLFFEICSNADRYDDLFIERFQASLVQEPKITGISSDESERIYRDYQTIVTDGIAAIDGYMNANKKTHAYYAAYGALFHLDYVFELQGVLGSRTKDLMEKSLATEWFASIPMVREWFVTLQGIDKQKFAGSCYYGQFMFAPKYVANDVTVARFFSGFEECIDSCQSAQDHELCALMISWLFYKASFDYELPPKARQLMAAGLAGSAGQPWAMASAQLYHFFGLLLNNNLASAAA